MWAPLIFGALSFGGSLLQGLGAKQSSAKQARLQAIADANAAQENARILNEVNAKREEVGRLIRDDLTQTDKIIEWAEKSGFNPVTFLNAGGLSHLANWADARKYSIPEYSLTQASQVPQQHSALSAFGGALSAGVNAFATQWRADQSYELNSRKLDLAEQSMIFGLSQRPTLGGTTRSVTYGSGGGAGFITAGVGATKAGGLSSMPYPEKWKPGGVEVTNPHYKWEVDKTQADAEAYETRYGDIAQEVFGAYNLVADSVKSWSGKTIGEWGQATRNWLNAGREVTRSGKVEPYAPFVGAYPVWANP